MFDAYAYFSKLHDEHKIAKGYQLCKISDPSSMEEVLSNFSTAKTYFGIDDTSDGVTFQGNGGGYYEKRIYVIHLMKKYDIRPIDKMDKQHEALEECRKIYRSICRRLVKDRQFLNNEMVYLHADRIPYYELPGYMISGVTGLYFIVTIDEPIDLCYDESEWD